jgi:hypothetical protein
MISDPLPQTLNPNSQLPVPPHLFSVDGKPYSRFVYAVNWLSVSKRKGSEDEDYRPVNR